jgi:hypothetical protein
MLAIGLTAAAWASGIVVTFDTTVPVAAQTEIANLVAQYDSLFTNLSLNLIVTFGNPIGPDVVQSNSFTVQTPYATWLSALAADSKANPNNSELAASENSLPATDPLDSGTVLLTSGYARAIGLSTPFPVDSTLTFSNSAPYNYMSVPTPGEYDFGDLFRHGVNESLGVFSALSGIPNFGPRPTTFFAQDYFRFSAPGMRGISTDPNANVYFSIDDGVTNVARFNQDNTFGDRHDWIYANPGYNGGPGCLGGGPGPAQPPGPFIQDALACKGVVIPFNPDSPEFKLLLALGYDQNVPEPASVLLCAAGLALLAGVRRRIFNR